MEKTAVQWLIDWMGKNQYFIGNDLLKIVKQAKKMEKEQIENAYNQGASNAFDNDYLDNFLKFNNSEDYYNKMYNKLNNK
jgi:hypothetical protein